MGEKTLALPKQLQKWEHTMRFANADTLATVLGQAGDDGWQLGGVLPQAGGAAILFFKRPK